MQHVLAVDTGHCHALEQLRRMFIAIDEDVYAQMWFHPHTGRCYQRERFVRCKYPPVRMTMWRHLRKDEVEGPIFATELSAAAYGRVLGGQEKTESAQLL